jgi:hypothetical protein
MTYALAAPLQAAIFARLSQDATLNALIGGAIYDAVPPGTPAGTFVLLGAEEASDRSDVSGYGAEHQVKISVVTASSGFAPAKDVAGRVCDCLLEASLPLDRGTVVGVWFQRASAVKASQGNVRRIDLTFRVRVAC